MKLEPTIRFSKVKDKEVHRVSYCGAATTISGTMYLEGSMWYFKSKINKDEPWALHPRLTVAKEELKYMLGMYVSLGLPNFGNPTPNPPRRPLPTTEPVETMEEHLSCTGDDIKVILHILRNPDGWHPETIKEVQNKAANLIERMQNEKPAR